MTTTPKPSVDEVMDLVKHWGNAPLDTTTGDELAERYEAIFMAVRSLSERPASDRDAADAERWREHVKLVRLAEPGSLLLRMSWRTEDDVCGIEEVLLKPDEESVKLCATYAFRKLRTEVMGAPVAAPTQADIKADTKAPFSEGKQADIEADIQAFVGGMELPTCYWKWQHPGKPQAEPVPAFFPNQMRAFAVQAIKQYVAQPQTEPQMSNEPDKFEPYRNAIQSAPCQESCKFRTWVMWTSATPVAAQPLPVDVPAVHPPVQPKEPLGPADPIDPAHRYGG